jgi:hypothetical protein
MSISKELDLAYSKSFSLFFLYFNLLTDFFHRIIPLFKFKENFLFFNLAIINLFAQIKSLKIPNFNFPLINLNSGPKLVKNFYSFQS